MNIPLNIDWQQILLHLFNFIILAVGLYLLLYKPIKDFMDKRTAYYQGLSDQAKQELDEAAMKKRDWDAKLAEVDGEIRAREKEANKKLSEEADEMRAQTQIQCDKLVAQARENAEREKEKILSEAKKEAGEFAIQAVEKLLNMTAEKPADDLFHAVEKEGGNDGA